MKYGKILVLKQELPIIRKLLLQPVAMRDVHYANSLAKLSQELELAESFDEKDMPSEVIRLNSSITIATSQNTKKTLQLVMPESSDIAKNKLSILTPMGLAVYGYAEGDQVVWEFPSGVNTINIVEVRQNENINDT